MSAKPKVPSPKIAKLERAIVRAAMEFQNPARNKSMREMDNIVHDLSQACARLELARREEKSQSVKGKKTIG